MSELADMQLQLDEGESGETRCYEWSVQIPPRSRIKENLEILNKFNYKSESMYIFENLVFKEGFLSEVMHQWSCAIICPFIVIKFGMSSYKEFEIHLRKCVIQAFSNGKFKDEISSDMRMEKSSMQEIRLWGTTPTAIIKVPDAVWDDSVDKLKIVFHIHREPVGKCITMTMPSVNWCDYETQETVGLELSAVKYLASQNMPDVTLVAEGQQFRAHQIILTSKSPVFERMFQNEMKESIERRIEIDDIRPEVLKELLHFIYNEEFLTTDEDDNHNRMFVELFKAGHKYGMEGLASKCGVRILERIVSFENAGEMYALGETYNEVFKRKAVEIVKKKASQAFKDSKSISDFFLQFPELAFEVFKK